MADDLDESESETGGSLRSKLEASVKANKQLADKLRTFEAKELIAAKGYKYVTAEDAAGVELDELPTKLAEIEKQKLATRESVLRDVLKGQGHEDGERLDEAVKSLLNPQESHAETSTRLASLSRISGDFPGVHDSDGLEGRALIRQGLIENASKRR